MTRSGGRAGPEQARCCCRVPRPAPPSQAPALLPRSRDQARPNWPPAQQVKRLDGNENWSQVMINYTDQHDSVLGLVQGIGVFSVRLPLSTESSCR